jgi:hypothetical protein
MEIFVTILEIIGYVFFAFCFYLRYKYGRGGIGAFKPKMSDSNKDEKNSGYIIVRGYEIIDQRKR